ncbi:DUF2993 domain-containing protein [Aetokthonos hydrillicola Thurmond2011]|jgi:hypothetical protein|uniref:DUF2993 domain-containing protein n=1 Tax=Aetokthonos hydrillicola Thurmond2011 TaxID=2712845 RepID=A0AAP5I4B5_9CYAN|nr:DUF2993 domain-containing protein [Aetokthonos hydrillicola]MBO3460858.1 DUF2993 domain-containing protein [Aetokthonos hydrillicola CCALA 1050]MBW4585651.1 DUF2993 domain-containing protein [Aetokthonos hydrillicola CCALA 1050]MDR9894551.1 DUF2993 domain-containing protein [Aetokthonos hydrillicola Thurmond2011]
MVEKNHKTRSLKKIRIVTNVLTTALKLWLRSQVSQISQLEVEIRASDRQILTGCIPWVSIFASNAVYKGLHLTQIQLIAENIRINIGSVLKGQPLQLLETVSVFGELTQEEEALQASLSSSLLSDALDDIFITILPNDSEKYRSITWQKINLDYDTVALTAISSEQEDIKQLNITLGLQLLSAYELQISPIHIGSNTVILLEANQNKHRLNLGSEVNIQELKLIPGKLMCRGRINVNP